MPGQNFARNDAKPAMGYGEEGEPCLGSSTGSSPHHSASASLTPRHRRRRETSASPAPCVALQRPTLLILLLLLVLLLAGVAVVFFAVGQWVAFRTARSVLPNATSSTLSPSPSSIRLANSMAEAELGRIWAEREAAAPETPIFRLPGDLVPIHYHLRMDLSKLESELELSGTVSILLSCRNATKTIVFHAAKNLDVSNPLLEEATAGERVPWKELRRVAEASTYEMEIDSFLLPQSKYRLRLDFATKVCQNGDHTYCSFTPLPRSGPPQIFATGLRRPVRNSTARPGEERVAPRGPLFLTTKLEPAGAKSLFPCWDEPGMKAVFNVSLLHPPDVVARTNAAPWRSFGQASGLTLALHHETPPMATFLFALAFGRYSAVERDVRSGVKLSVWTPPQHIAKTEFALSFGASMLDRLESYFVTRYPMRKLDFVTAKTYPVGAMENWGLIVFHEEMLLSGSSVSDPMAWEGAEGSGEGSEEPRPARAAAERRGEGATVEEVQAYAQRYRATKIITHELLHQWFGNLVTMSWWSELWLSEGLTTFFVQHFVRADFPALTRYEETLLLDKVWRAQAAGERFSLVRSFSSDEAVLRSFNLLHLYTKGALVSRMLFDLLGERTLRAGLVEYLRTSAYSSVTGQQLWRHLGSISHFSRRPVNIGSVMEPWVRNRGFPAVTLTRDADGLISVTQAPADAKAFREWETEKPSDSPLESWWIPVHYSLLLAPSTGPAAWGEKEKRADAEAQRAPFWLTNATHSFTDLQMGQEDALLANPALQFPFRVNYDLRNWRLLIAELHRDHGKIPERSRVQLLLDSELFLKGTQEGVIHFYDLLDYLQKETELLPILTGVDVVYDAVAAYKGSRVFPLLLVLLRGTVGQMERVRKASEGSLEEEAIWSLDRRRQASFNLLRCALALPQCRMGRAEAQRLLLTATSRRGEKTAALCHFLHRQATVADNLALLEALRQPSEAGARHGHRAQPQMHAILAGACSRDSTVNSKAIQRILSSPNAGYLAMVLGSKILVYNRGFREALWPAVQRLPHRQKVRLLGRRALAAICLASVGSVRELALAAKALPGLRQQKRRLRRRLKWQAEKAEPRLEQWLFQKLKL